MRNGPYELVVAPPDYPGKRYRDRYCYEHHLIWWQETGELLEPGEVLHHINGEKRDNRFENLEKMSNVEHSREHTLSRGRVMVDIRCPMCHTVFTRRRSKTHLSREETQNTFCSSACSGRSSTVKVESTEVLRVYREYSDVG